MQLVGYISAWSGVIFLEEFNQFVLATVNPLVFISLLMGTLGRTCVQGTVKPWKDITG